jgi:hypothetical protein
MLSYLPRALTLFAFASGAGTGAVLDIERLVQGFAQLLGDIASEDVRSRAGRASVDTGQELGRTPGIGARQARHVEFWLLGARIELPYGGGTGPGR